ncbi:MAG: tetratricopeptide repeat protein, partial [Planctomycetota bacterium]
MEWGRIAASVSVVALLVAVGCKSDGWSFPKLSLGKSEASMSEAPAWNGNPLAKSDKNDSASKKLTDAEYASLLTQARGLERSDKLDEARKLYRKLIDGRPDRYEAYQRLGVVADRQKRFLEAEGLYAEAIRLNPTEPDLFNDLGYCYLLQGKLAKAESALLKAVALKPSNERYRNNLGLVYAYQGRDDKALAQFRMVGSEADALCNLAYVYSVKGDHERAQQCLELALRTDPYHEGARTALAAYAEGYVPDAVDTLPPVYADDGRPWR